MYTYIYIYIFIYLFIYLFIYSYMLSLLCLPFRPVTSFCLATCCLSVLSHLSLRSAASLARPGSRVGQMCPPHGGTGLLKPATRRMSASAARLPPRAFWQPRRGSPRAAPNPRPSGWREEIHVPLSPFHPLAAPSGDVPAKAGRELRLAVQCVGHCVVQCKGAASLF